MPEEISFPLFSTALHKYESEIINFLVDSGKDKRTTIESHILAYFLLRQGLWLSQDDIRSLSFVFFEDGGKKGISTGSISLFINRYVELQVLGKRPKPEKPKALEYTSIGSMRDISTATIAFGIDVIDQDLSFLETQLAVIRLNSPEGKDEKALQEVLEKRVKELLDFFLCHKYIIEKAIKQTRTKRESASSRNLPNVSPPLQKIEENLIQFILECPFFQFQNIKHHILMAYFFTRAELTQEEAAQLTGLASGTISEDLNEYVDAGFIKLLKIKGIRKRFYKLESIPYYNYLQLDRIFQESIQQYENLYNTHKELLEKEELRANTGYQYILSLSEQLLQTKSFVDLLGQYFHQARQRFTPSN